MNARLKIGSLCSGYGGLDLAIEQFFGAETAWFSEFEAAPSRILDAHWPGVPNLGDMTKIDWSAVEPVDIIAGGTPCQDLSGAGKRKGMTEGTRSNLWVQMREAIAVIRPAIVVWENVRGAYSACAESEIDSDLGRCPRCADPASKAEHAPNLRALARVLGDLDGLGFDAEWVGLRASDAGAPHERFRVFVVAYRRGETRDFWAGFGAAREEALGRGRSGDVEVAAPSLLRFPTPRASDGEKGGPNQKGSRGDLTMNSAVALLPTVMAAEGEKATTRQGVAQKSSTGQVWLTNVAHDLQRPDLAVLPTPTASYGGGTAAAHVARKNKNGGGREAVTGLNFVVEEFLPTPTTAIATGGNARRGGDRAGEKLLPGIVQDDLDQMVTPEGSTMTPDEYEAMWATLEDQSPFWVTVEGKDYWPAVQRWAEVIGRPAPAPTLPDGRDGRHRLSARLTEWMMGQADRWITDPAIGLTRNEQLKACGNGVVTQQCELALDIAWPRILEAVAA